MRSMETTTQESNIMTATETITIFAALDGIDPDDVLAIEQELEAQDATTIAHLSDTTDRYYLIVDDSGHLMTAAEALAELHRLGWGN